MKSGLDDVIAAETQLSDVDGAAGRLIIRGVSLDDLVATSRFEDVAALLLGGMFEDAIDAAKSGRVWVRPGSTSTGTSPPPTPTFCPCHPSKPSAR